MDELVSLPVLAVGVVLKDVVGVHGGCTQPVGTNVQILSPRQAVGGTPPTTWNRCTHLWKADGWRGLVAW